MCIGGFPEAVAATSSRDRTEFLADYVRTVSQRDIAEMGRLAERVELETVLRLLAERTASVLTAASLSDAARMSADSMRRYLPLVETSSCRTCFRRLPAALQRVLDGTKKFT